MNKHVNTKYPKEESNKSKTMYGHIVTENDMFQLEIVKGETVFACNICEEGFDFIDEVNIHIADAHADIMSHI